MTEEAGIAIAGGTPGRATRGPEVLYLALAVLGLAGTWAQGLGYLDLGFVGGTVQFWKDVFSSPSSIFLSVDILVLAAALFVWMFGDARRHGIAPGWTWACYLASMLIAISFAVPLYMAFRQRRLRLQQAAAQGVPAGADFVAIAIAVALAVTAVMYSLGHAG